METKPNYILVGAFVIVLSAAIVIILLWLFGYRANESYKTYLILTKYSVNGLSQNSLVKYKGVNVGSVEKIDIDPNNPEIVRIFIKVKSNIPIKTDTIASVSVQGLTGLASIDLTGGTKNAPSLESVDHHEYPIIKSKMSELQKISQALPSLLDSANTLIKSMSEVFNENNRQQISSILKNTDKVSKELFVELSNLNSTINKTNEAMDSIKQAGQSAKDAFLSTNKLIESLQESSKNLAQISLNLNQLISENKNQVNYFTHESLYNLNKLIEEVNKTTKTTNALINELRSNPSYILYGKPKTPAPTEKGSTQ
ncbi:putative ABC transport system periplasmic substrate-binding protein [Desulfurella amilsii]|uniref:Putative ABC transport system periplasmic substrate-binding protein n=1 Tax=Desulfurella amilsii TaxID=1562698 RepID=A0A1X4XXG7_9BACT|nr:MlaD family protein [Desulfurella amilsii]OSS42229.1 putative ABC transport system periplasmic substrate-binding protein [Desulfurella amilsii]